MIKTQKTKTLITKPNNNSANCIAPNLIYGCYGGCVDTYCYMSRYNGKRVFVNTNVDDIFQSVVEWEKGYTKVPDQQDPVYTMVDIACNTDLVLMQKHLPESLYDYLKRYDDHPRLNTTMATKYPGLLKLNVNNFNSGGYIKTHTCRRRNRPHLNICFLWAYNRQAQIYLDGFVMKRCLKLRSEYAAWLAGNNSGRCVFIRLRRA